MSIDSRGASGTRALIVGSSSGIGREIALRLADLGAAVAFHGRRRDKLDEAVAEANTTDAFAVVGDIGDPAECEAIVGIAVDRLSGLDLLVCSASLSALNLVRDTLPDEWNRIYAANVIGPALLARAALRSMAPGSICAFISSESVGAPYHGLVPYGSSKAALEEVVRGLRVEHPQMKFSCIRVGQTMPTDFAREFAPEVAAELIPRWVAMGRIPAQGMEARGLGRAIADTLVIAGMTPSVEFQDLVLRAPGGPMTGDGTTTLRELDEAQAALAATD